MSTGVWPHSFREFKLVKTDSELKWGNLAAYEFELEGLVDFCNLFFEFGIFCPEV